MSYPGYIIAGIAILLALVLISGMKLKPFRKRLTAEQKRELLDTPKPQLQHRAYWGLVIGVVTLLATTLAVNDVGVTNYLDDDDGRLRVTLIFVAGIILYGIVLPFHLHRQKRNHHLDERDASILARAPSFQTIAIVLTTLAWVIGLSEAYWEQGTVPIAYLNMIFGSILIVNIIAQSFGILMGYWLSQTDYA